MNPSAPPSSELRYRRLFEAARDGILILNSKTGRITDVNPFMMEFLDYSRDDFIGKELFDIGLLKDREANQAVFRELQTAGYIRYEHLPLQTRDGRHVDVEFVSNLYKEGEQMVIQCNIRDITARKKTDEALRDAKRELLQHARNLETMVSLRTAELRLSNTQLETFVYSIAHDLRAPLRTMQGFAQLLAENHAASLSPEGRDYANFINSAAQTMDHLLADLLDFSHVSQQKIELVPVNLDQALSEVLEVCETEVRRSGAQVENLPPWPVVLAHPTTLRQVLVNLLGNALKFVSGTAPHIRIRSEERPGGIVRIWIEDNGIGIAPEFHERIFQVFQRLHTEQYNGTGIGLAIVQKGVERMGGRTGLVSAPGKGSKFWIELCQVAARPPAGQPRP